MSPKKSHLDTSSVPLEPGKAVHGLVATKGKLRICLGTAVAAIWTESTVLTYVIRFS